MKDLGVHQDQHDYFRVMEKRIRYYADKYDPHTLICDRDISAVEKPAPALVSRRKRIASVCAHVLNIF